MTPVLLVLAQAPVIGAFLWLQNAQAKRHDHERQQWRGMVSELCERVQRPELKPTTDLPEQDRPVFVPSHDDDAYWGARE